MLLVVRVVVDRVFPTQILLYDGKCENVNGIIILYSMYFLLNYVCDVCEYACDVCLCLSCLDV